MKINSTKLDSCPSVPQIFAVQGLRRFLSFNDGYISYMHDDTDNTVQRFVVQEYTDGEKFHKDPGGQYMGSYLHNPEGTSRVHVFVKVTS